MAAGHPAANARLMNDVTLNTGVLAADSTLAEGTFRQWSPIGTTKVPYTGTFDGQHHIIFGLYFNLPSEGVYPSGGSRVGLFGNTSKANLRNIDLRGGYINGGEYVGGVAGRAVDTKITRCHNGNTIQSNVYGYVGGIVGHFLGNDTCAVEYCYNTGKIGRDYNRLLVGGIVGSMTAGTTKYCYNLGPVMGESNVGSIAGDANATSIVWCYYQPATAYASGHTKQRGRGSSMQGTYMADVYASTDTISQAILASGEMTWHLNGETAEGDVAWHQDLTADTYPLLTGTAKVYASGTIHCNGKSEGLVYQNTPASLVYETHSYVDNLCENCGHLHPDYSIEPVDGVYQIATAADLYFFANTLNAYTSTSSSNVVRAVLTEDIVVNPNCRASAEAGIMPKMEWTPMMSSSNARPVYFDGQGHTISGLYFNNTLVANRSAGGGNYVGLFGYFSAGTISNLGIIDSYIRGADQVGAIVGNAVSLYSNRPVLIANCYSDAYVEGNSRSGGLVGAAYRSTTKITDCYFSGHAHTEAGSYTGGICGYAQSLSISNCLSIGEVTSNKWSSTGAICHTDQAVVTNCYYLEGSAHNINGTLLYGVNSNYGSEDQEGQAVTVTRDQLASGEVCWHLNGSSNDTTFRWFQTLPGDTIPTFVSTGSNNVYVLSDLRCDGQPKAAAYSNVYHTPVTDEHNHVDGLCTVCNHCVESWLTPAADGVFEIATPAQLYWFTEYVAVGHPAANARVMADIALNENVLTESGTLAEGSFRQWHPIGTVGAPYTGSFDGQLHKITGLYIDRAFDAAYPSGGNYSGFFGYISKADIRNVDLEGGYINGGNYVGGVAGYVSNSNITRCHNGNTVNPNVYGNAGGIAGIYLAADTCAIAYCYNTGKIGINNQRLIMGGLVGSLGGPLQYSYNTGEVRGSTNVGAVAGSANHLDVTGCYYQPGVAVSGSSSSAQRGLGSSSAGTYSPDVEYHTDPISDSLLLSGELTWRMNGTSLEPVWFQTVGTTNLPAYEGDTVFRVINCPSGYAYQNTRNQLHQLEYALALDPTCSVHGHIAGYTCSSCGKHFSDAGALEEIGIRDWMVGALGHAAVADSAVAATCLETGLSAGSHCSRCDTVIVPQTVVPALGHDTIIYAAVKATCTQTGLSEGHRCSRCDDYTLAQDTLPALGHEFLTYVYNEDATIEADGTETAHCEHGCGLTDTRTAEGTRIIEDAISDILGDEALITARHHLIVIENAAGTIRVFDAAGHLVAQTQDAICHEHTEIEVSAHGTYIVECANATRKVVIR